MEATANSENPTVGRPRHKRWLRWSAVLLAVAGWWLSIDLLRLTGGGKASNPWLQAACGQTEAGPSDCLSVLRSSWARTIPPASSEAAADQRVGLPWAALGAAYFAFVGVWYLFVGPPTRERAAWHFVITAVVAAGVYHSVYFLQIMAFVLKRWCAGCVAAHAVNGMLAILTVLAFPWRRQATPGRPHPSRSLALATLCAGLFLGWAHVSETRLLVTSAGARQLTQQYLAVVNDPEFVRWDYQRQGVQAIATRAEQAFVGVAEAPNTLVAFMDFQCGACRLAHDMLTKVLQKYPDRLRVAFLHFPQDPKCNPNFAQVGHPQACRAARAAEAAGMLGGPDMAEKMRALLHARRHEFAPDRFALWAADIGLDPQDFVAAMESDAAFAALRADIDLGTRLGIKSVPALFLNNRRLKHWRNPKIWEALLGAAGEPLPADARP